MGWMVFGSGHAGGQAELDTCSRPTSDSTHCCTNESHQQRRCSAAAAERSLTVQPLDAPDVVPGDVPLSRVGGVGMHQSLGVSGVPQAEGVADLMGRHLDQVVEPHPCSHTSTLEPSRRSRPCAGLVLQYLVSS